MGLHCVDVVIMMDTISVGKRSPRELRNKDEKTYSIIRGYSGQRGKLCNIRFRMFDVRYNVTLATECEVRGVTPSK